ncbi:hypothetical protein C8R45DRAFT_1172626 [Mycena sanguinolenta]|nr:hypothetical protein C8R45DRAFT_1172626 [Mycena sanguinolenta]
MVLVHTALPVEILAQIFELTDTITISSYLYFEDAHRVSQVDLSDCGQEQRYTEGLDAWLARSEPLLIPVSLKFDGQTISHRAVEIILKTAPRLRSIRCINFFPLPIISRLAACRLDSLEELELGMADEYPIPPVFTTVPCLRKFSMILRYPPKEPQVLVPWAQLTDVTLENNSPDLILDILAQCTALTRLSICTSGWPSSTPARLAQRSLAFTQMKTLSIEFGFPSHVTRVLGSLSALAVAELHLNFLKMCNPSQSALEPGNLIAFLIRSLDITRLEIRCGAQGLASHPLITVLEHTPRLTHLQIAYAHRHSFDNALVDALSYKDGPGAAPLVPHLYNLVLDKISEDGFAMVNLARMFVSRWRVDAESHSHAVTRWSRAELWGNYSESFVESIQALQQKGLPLALIDKANLV